MSPQNSPLCLFGAQSIVMPVYNASCWLDECLQAVSQQDFTGTMELSVFDDASTVSVFSYPYKWISSRLRLRRSRPLCVCLLGWFQECSRGVEGEAGGEGHLGDDLRSQLRTAQRRLAVSCRLFTKRQKAIFCKIKHSLTCYLFECWLAHDQMHETAPAAM